MQLPFTTEQFFDVFRAYNTAVWPAQLVLVVLASWASRCWPSRGRRRCRAADRLRAGTAANPGVTQHAFAPCGSS